MLYNITHMTAIRTCSSLRKGDSKGLNELLITYYLKSVQVSSVSTSILFQKSLQIYAHQRMVSYV